MEGPFMSSKYYNNYALSASTMVITTEKLNLLFTVKGDINSYIKTNEPSLYLNSCIAFYWTLISTLILLISCFTQGVIYAHLGLSWEFPTSWDYIIIYICSFFISYRFIKYLTYELYRPLSYITTSFYNYYVHITFIGSNWWLLNKELKYFFNNKSFWLDLLKVENELTDLKVGEHDINAETWTFNDMMLVYCNFIVNKSKYNFDYNTYFFIKTILEIQIASFLINCSKKDINKFLHCYVEDIADMASIKALLDKLQGIL